MPINIREIIHVASDKTNAEILKRVPTNVYVLMKELNLTKMPINVRLNTLERHGLIRRYKGTGSITKTGLLTSYYEMIYRLQIKKAWLDTTKKQEEQYEGFNE